MQSAVMLLFLNSIGHHIAKKLLRLKKTHVLTNDDSDSDFEVLSGPSENCTNLQTQHSLKRKLNSKFLERYSGLKVR